MKPKSVLFVGINYTNIPPLDRKRWGNKVATRIHKNLRNKKVSVCVFDRGLIDPKDVFLVRF